MVGIISNTSAMQAQRNLEMANVSSQNSIARLSSGGRIVRAADDVAGLSVGTILRTNVSTMKAALTNTTQAQSLLGLADGALANIGDILQRQKALAAQATSGSLDASARSFLNQEFQGLREEIDRISVSTNFNGIKLIDGGLFAPNKFNFDVAQDATRASGIVAMANALADTETFVIDTGGAAAITWTAKAANTSPAEPDSLLTIDVGTYSTTAQQISYILDSYKQILNYNGTNATMLTTKANLSRYEILPVTGSTTQLEIKHRAAGTVHNTIKISTSNATDNHLTLNGLNAANGNTPDFDDSGKGAVNGALNAGTFSTTATGFGGTATTIAQGSVGDSILRALDTDTVANTGVNAQNISNNPDFVGKISGMKAIFKGDESVDLEIKVGKYNYVAKGVRTNYGADTMVELYSNDPYHGGSLRLQFANGQGVSSVKDQFDADVFAERLNKALSTVDFYQKREILNYKAAGTVYPTGSTTASGNLSGSQFWSIGKDFQEVRVEDVKVQAPVVGATQATIEFTINGEIYRSGYDFDGSVRALGTSITNTSGSGNDGRIGFVSQTNPNNVLVMDYASATNLSIANLSEAEGLEKALKSAFGISGMAPSNSSLSYQVGTKPEDSITVQIQGTTTREIYIDDNKNYKELDILTADTAKSTGSIIDNAINRVTAIRANVGSLQSRFDFASSNLRSSIENTDAARSIFLDTDVAAESSALAQAQVRLQASISVLAQANALPQSLLKLIG